MHSRNARAFRFFLTDPHVHKHWQIHTHREREKFCTCASIGYVWRSAREFERKRVCCLCVRIVKNDWTPFVSFCGWKKRTNKKKRKKTFPVLFLSLPCMHKRMRIHLAWPFYVLMLVYDSCVCALYAMISLMANRLCGLNFSLKACNLYRYSIILYSFFPRALLIR